MLRGPPCSVHGDQGAALFVVNPSHLHYNIIWRGSVLIWGCWTVSARMRVVLYTPELSRISKVVNDPTHQEVISRESQKYSNLTWKREMSGDRLDLNQIVDHDPSYEKSTRIAGNLVSHFAWNLEKLERKTLEMLSGRLDPRLRIVTTRYVKSRPDSPEVISR